MEILAILETLEELVEKSVGIPFSGRCLTDREELLEIIKEIRLKLPDDIKQAKWVKEERQRILHEAQKEAENMVKDAEKKITTLINEHEITKKAYEQANDIIASAQKTSREVKSGVMEYADEILAKIEEGLIKTTETIRSNRSELKQ
ncbi:MAG: ATPase [Eubacteriales bacterium]|nr:ATPase [Eubacteriales bacterium]